MDGQPDACRPVACLRVEQSNSSLKRGVRTVSILQMSMQPEFLNEILADYDMREDLLDLVRFCQRKHPPRTVVYWGRAGWIGSWKAMIAA